MKKLFKHYKKTLILLSVFFCFIIFLLIYSFYPVITYKENSEEKAWNLVLYDRNWKLITDKMYKNWYYNFFSIDKNSEFVKWLFKIEDKNYYTHYWVNILSKLRAIKDNISWRKISWASTITEQYIKNKYFINEKRTYLQKVRESILAVWFSFTRKKENILNIYCHDVFLWNNNYWIWII